MIELYKNKGNNPGGIIPLLNLENINFNSRNSFYKHHQENSTVE